MRLSIMQYKMRNPAGLSLRTHLGPMGTGFPVLLGLSALLTLLAGFPAPLRAQLAPSPDASPVSNAPPPKPEEGESVTTLKVDVNLVSLYFTVKDKSGMLIPHLSKDNCSVEEDKSL